MKSLKIFFVSLLSLVASVSAAKAEVGDFRFAISGPITLIEGELGYGAYLDFLYEIHPGLHIGLESGGSFWSDSGNDVSASVWIVPILPTAMYFFTLNSSKVFHPMLGVGLGPSIAHGSVKFGGSTFSSTQTYFTALFHVGAGVGEKKNFLIDLKLGVIDGSFWLAPSLGYMF